MKNLEIELQYFVFCCMRTILAGLKGDCDPSMWTAFRGNYKYNTGDTVCYSLYSRIQGEIGMFWANVNKDEFEIKYSTDGTTFKKPKPNELGYVGKAIIKVKYIGNKNDTLFNAIPLVKSMAERQYIYGSGNITVNNINNTKWLRYLHSPGPSNKTYQVIFDNSYLTDVVSICNMSTSDFPVIYSPHEFSDVCDFYVNGGEKDISIKNTCEENSCFNVKTGIVQDKEYFLTEEDNFVEDSPDNYAVPDYYFGYKTYIMIGAIVLGILDCSCTFCGCFGCYKCCRFKKLMKQKAEASSSSSYSYSYSSSKYSSYSYSKKNKSVDLKEV